MLEVMDPKSRQLQCFLTLSALFKTFYMSHAVEDLTSHVTLVTSSLNCNYVISQNVPSSDEQEETAVFVGYSVTCTQTSDIIGDICILEARVVWRVMRIWNKFVKKKTEQMK